MARDPKELRRRMQIAARLLVSAGASMAILAALPLSGCTSSQDRASPAAMSATSTAASSSAPRAASSPTTSPTRTKPTTVQTSSIVIPPNLCAATDKAQDTADAYMGSLSAGQESQALDCVYPNTVPASTTHGLVAHASRTAVYLPDATASHGNVFVYVGNGKTVSVTVTRQADGKTWVTQVTVR
jgi:hypothetical protein